MTEDLVAHIKDRGDWLVDAVATATQNRQFLRGDPECDDVACDAIRLNGEKAMALVAKPLADRIEELEAKLEKSEARSEVLETLIMDVAADLYDGVAAHKIDQRIGDVMKQLNEEEEED